MIYGHPITIYGDGEQTRDFINVGDVARANFMAGMNKGVSGSFNLGSGSRVTINELINCLEMVSGLNTQKTYAPPRYGDVRHSMADISKISTSIGFKPQIVLKEGLGEYMDWAKWAFKSALS
jgi:UDP-glucose 4-epimerase